MRLLIVLKAINAACPAYFQQRKFALIAFEIARSFWKACLLYALKSPC